MITVEFHLFINIFIFWDCHPSAELICNLYIWIPHI